MPKAIRQMAQKVLRDPVEINIAMSKPAEKIVQKAFVVFDPQKIPLIKMLLKETEMKRVLIFCSTKEKTRQVYQELKRTGIRAEEIHSTLEQAARERGQQQKQQERGSLAHDVNRETSSPSIGFRRASV